MKTLYFCFYAVLISLISAKKKGMIIKTNQIMRIYQLVIPLFCHQSLILSVGSGCALCGIEFRGGEAGLTGADYTDYITGRHARETQVYFIN